MKTQNEKGTNKSKPKINYNKYIIIIIMYIMLMGSCQNLRNFFPSVVFRFVGQLLQALPLL